MTASETFFRIVAVDDTNAAFVGAVFRSVYGEDFPVKDVYQPRILEQRIRDGQMTACLALDASGKPVGYISMFKNAPNPGLWEGGNLIVDPAYAHTGLGSQLFPHYLDALKNHTLDGDGIYSESVCHHYFTQMGCTKSGMFDCALELDLLDGASFKNRLPETERVACVFTCIEMTDPPSVAYLPSYYADVLAGLARPLRSRSFQMSRAPLPDDGLTVWEEHYFPSARTRKVSVREVGADWSEVLTILLAKGGEQGVISLQVILNTAIPHIGEAVSLMRQRGFFFGGLIPRWFQTDGVLMQQILGKEPDYDGVKLYTRTAKDLLDYIRTDRDKVKQP